MAFTKFLCLVIGVMGGAAIAVAELSAELSDLAGRIAYGFYVEDENAIEAAQRALARMSDDDADVRYYKAFAALRRAQLRVQSGRSADDLAAACAAGAAPRTNGERLARAEAEARRKASAEAWIVVAACEGLVGRSDGVSGIARNRRVEQALAKARELDAANPRVALLDAWLVSRRPAIAAPDVRDAAVEKLDAALAAFAARPSTFDASDWGEPEALAARAEVYLERGEVRAARDLTERALLLAPDYAFAVELRGRLANPRR